MSELLYRPLTEIVDLLQRRELSPVELLETTLERIQETHAKLNAFSVVRDSAALLDEARAAETRLAQGEGRPLEGVPLGVKDLEDVRGLVTSHGSVPFRDNVAERDSIQVERLRAAGAIVVGKTNAPEFGYTAITKNLLFGVTHNPWDLERTPGGSSGGTSAAIAGGVLPLGTASDGGGSVRLPATFTGCFGLKTSFGRIPHGPDPIWTNIDTSVHGPLTRTVEDAALHLDCVVGPHPLSPNSLPHPGYSYRAVLQQLPASLRIGFSPDLGYGVVQSDVAEVVAEAAHVFEELGHSLELVRGGPPDMGWHWGIANAFETAAKLHELLPEHEADFGRAFLRGTKAGWKMTPEIWAKANRDREALNRWCAEIFERYDLLMLPTTISDPPPAKGPLPTEVEGKPVPFGSSGTLTIPFNLSWHPAGTVRAGFSRAGLPVGLQIVAPRHRDDLVLQAAYAFQEARPWKDHWPRI